MGLRHSVMSKMGYRKGPHDHRREEMQKATPQWKTYNVTHTDTTNFNQQR